MGMLDFLIGGKPAMPNAPGFNLPSWAEGLPPEILNAIRGQMGQQLQEPGEYGYASDYLKNLMGYQPSQFQFPMEDIQRALQAQQGLQMEQYQKQIRPMLAQQGQLDSSYYTNLIGDYLKGQQAQTYGTTADLLTQQALNNMNIQQWLPQFQSGVAGQLAGLGGQRAGIGEFNLQYPYQGISALSGMFGQGMDLAGQQYQAALLPYQQAMQQYNEQLKQRAAGKSAIGSLAGMGIGVALAPFTGGLSIPAAAMLGGSIGGQASTLFGGSGGGIDLGSAINYAYPTQMRFPWQQMGGGGYGWSGKKYGSNTPFGAYDFGSYSSLPGIGG